MAFACASWAFGGIITEIDVPDRTGRLDDIALGLKTLQEYETLPAHFGAITGQRVWEVP
jgi:aldose 1-epimerase